MSSEDAFVHFRKILSKMLKAKKVDEEGGGPNALLENT